VYVQYYGDVRFLPKRACGQQPTAQDKRYLENGVPREDKVL